MKYWIFGCLLLSVIMVTPPAGAQIPDQVDITGSTPWLVAGGGERATISVEVLDGTTPLAGLDVAFSVDAAYGSITPASGVTDANGRATATFTPGTLSGDAPITVRVTYPDGEIIQDCLQQIDHAEPYALAGLAYAAEATVGEETDIVVRLADRYGNPIDSRNTAESVIFAVSSSGGTAGFVNGGDCETRIAVAVDTAGDATGTLRIDQRAGENIIVIDSPGSIPDTFFSILGVANGTPAGITSVVSPSTGSPPYVPADGTSAFSFTYTLFDRYGNPVQGQDLWVNTTIGGEDELLTTSSSGQVSITYGPKETTGRVTITATAAANASVTESREVEFTSTDPVNMLLTASPQTMPSRDVKPDSVALVRAKVMDIKGNPVENETVTFTLLSVDNGTYIQTQAPQLGGQGVGVPVSNSTDDDGYAVVQFTPGAFVTRGMAGYDPTATGTCTVEAAWGNVTRTIVLTWKNYPYLSVETSVSPETVAVNGTIDTTIRLRGDGWALQPDPIDVVLVIDRSGSMRYTDVSPSRLGAAQSAALTFIDQMSSVRDRVGLVSFSSSTTRDDDLTCSFETVKSDINSLSPNGATQLRRAIYEAILMEQEQGRAEAVKAVVVLTDGDWNYDGSPIGHGKGYPANSSWAYTFSGSSLEPDHYRYYDGLGGTLKWKYTWGGNYLYCTDGEWTNQNMSRFADANGVKLYTITFAYNPSTTVRDTMRVLANATGGFYEHATDGTQLTDIYRRIAGELKVEAGVNTTMDVCFENVEVNGTPKNGADVFDYVYAEDYSTRICSYRTYPNGTTVDMFPEYTRSDAQNWTGENPVLHFDVGTVRLNQTWETTFRLKVLADGNINVFGSGSTIIFNDGTDTLDLPDLFITAIPDLNNTGVETGSLDIANLRCTGSGPYLDFLPLAWDLTYTGADEVTEDIYCQNDGVSWIYAASKTPEMAGGTTITENYLLDVRHLPPGTYTVRVRVTAPDAPVDQETLAVVDRVGPSENSVYIRIQ